MRSDIAQGNGMYKSTDGGKTWSHIGLADSQQIGRIVVHPANPDIVYVAALGHPYGPNAERGVFRSRDGGTTWQNMLSHTTTTPARSTSPSSPGNPDVIYARSGRRGARRGASIRRRTGRAAVCSSRPTAAITGRRSPATAFRRSRGASASPSRRRSRSASTRSSTRSRRRHVSLRRRRRELDARQQRSRASGGAAGTSAGSPSSRRTPTSSTPATSTSIARPTAARTSCRSKARRAATTITSSGSIREHPERRILGVDQGTVISVNGGDTWSSWYNQPTGQFYHVITDNRFPYWVYGAQQDSGAARIPSRTSTIDGIKLMEFRETTAGGESDNLAPDPKDPDMILRRPRRSARHCARSRRGRSIRRSPIPATTAAPGRCRWCSRRAIRACSISRISGCSAPTTAASTGR